MSADKISPEYLLTLASRKIYLPTKLPINEDLRSWVEAISEYGVLPAEPPPTATSSFTFGFLFRIVRKSATPWNPDQKIQRFCKNQDQDKDVKKY